MTTDEHFHCHVREKAQPERKVDLVLDKAARLGWEKFEVESHGIGSFGDFKAAFSLGLDYYLIHDRRAR